MKLSQVTGLGYRYNKQALADRRAARTMTGMVASQASMPGRLEATATPPKPGEAAEVFGQYDAAVSGASAVLLLFAIITIEKLTGSEIRLQILYLVPVAIMTWSVGRTWGFVMAIGAVAESFATYHANHLYPGGLLHYWEMGVVLGTLVLFVFLIARLHAALDAARRGE